MSYDNSVEQDHEICWLTQCRPRLLQKALKAREYVLEPVKWTKVMGYPPI